MLLDANQMKTVEMKKLVFTDNVFNHVIIQILVVSIHNVLQLDTDQDAHVHPDTLAMQTFNAHLL